MTEKEESKTEKTEQKEDKAEVVTAEQVKKHPKLPDAKPEWNEFFGKDQ